MFLREVPLVHTPTNSQPPSRKSYHAFFLLNRNEMLVLHNLNLINLYMYILIKHVNTCIVLINEITINCNDPLSVNGMTLLWRAGKPKCILFR